MTDGKMNNMKYDFVFEEDKNLVTVTASKDGLVGTFLLSLDNSIAEFERAGRAIVKQFNDQKRKTIS